MRFLVQALVSAALMPLIAQAQAPVVAHVYVAEGSVEVRTSSSSSSSEWKPIQVNAPLGVGDTVRTGEDGSAAFRFVDGALVRMGRLSALTFNTVAANGSPAVTQSRGRTFFFSREARKEPLIKTPQLNAAIYGTELVVDVSDTSTTVEVLHGSIRASNASGDVSAGAGESVTARRGAMIAKSIIVKPAGAVQWMIRFPFILTAEDLAPHEDTTCSSQCTAAVRAVLAHALQGHSLYTEINKLSASIRETHRAKILQAIALWRIGDDPAARQIMATLPAHLGARDAALRQVLLGFSELLNQNLPAAREYLRSSESLQPKLANAALLRSYIAQSQGDFDDALVIASQAHAEHPAVPELFDRDAELLLSADKYEEATQVLDTRLKRFGTSALSSTLAGFAALANKEYNDAATLFKQAIQQDPSQPLPYLGEALIQANSRDYITAKDKLSQAVQLDPSVAVYRSYLGKLLFEDEQSSKAMAEFNAATAIDPNDPTPYLYRSYAKVAQNDPIGGLKDVEESIVRNEGRAVYRSSLMLDRDVGVRSAGLARTFNELGFSEAARIEAIKSVTDDYSNYSAHRLLSDSYDSLSTRPAYFSEQRIADILAPLSFNLFNSLGEIPSLSDYNALFDKKETRMETGGAWNSNGDQAQGSLLATGKGDHYGYLLSYKPSYAQGSHHGAFFGENTLRGAVQYETSPNDRFILDGEFKALELNGDEQGDYSDNFHLGNARLGYNHRFSTNLKFLAQGEYERSSDHSSEQYERLVGVEIPDAGEESSAVALLNDYTHQRVTRGGLSNQLIYASHYVDSVTGVEGMYVDTSRREDAPVLDMTDFPPPSSLTSSSAGNLSSGSVYEYLSLKVPRRATLTLGGAASHLERDLSEIPPFVDGADTLNTFDPKVGLVLTPNSWLTGRFAYFETTNRTVLEDLSSLEPTLVGGINQRFSDLSGTESRNLGFGLDMKEANLIYAGAQYTRRNLLYSYGETEDLLQFNGQTTTQVGTVNNGLRDTHADADILRGYVYTILSSSSTVTTDVLYQQYADTDDELRNDPSYDAAVSTQRYRFGYRYFVGKHLSFLTQATYRDQQLNQTDDPCGFWLFDLGAQYRFAEQHGRMFARVDNILDRDFTYNQYGGAEPGFGVLEGRSFIIGISYNFF